MGTLLSFTSTRKYEGCPLYLPGHDGGTTYSDFTVHVDEQDRTFCQISTNHACAAACNGRGCTETCISSCGIFSRPFSYLCSAVAASTCTAATTAASPASASAPFTV